MGDGTLAGKVALVTGGASGIGRATCLALAREGARVVVVGRTTEVAEETVRRIAAAGGEAIAVGADVSVEADVEAMVAAAVERYGSLDVAVNNAGNAGRFGRMVDQTLDDVAYTMATNFQGVWLGMKHELRQMLVQGGGSIVNTASNLAYIGQPEMSLYVASKCAVIGLTRSAALEYSTEGIRVNAVCPGPTETELAERVAGSLEAFRDALAPKQPMGRVGQPEEVAEAILWLARSTSSLVTGHALIVDGGAAAQ